MKRGAAKQRQLAASDANRPESSSIPSSTTSTTSSSSDAIASDTAPASPKRIVTIRLAGKEYRLRSDASEESLQQVAGYVDQSMQKIRERTDTVDSLDTALLTALNLAREILNLRGQAGASGKAKNEARSNHSDLDDNSETDSDTDSDNVSDSRLRGLIEQIEAALPAAESARP